MSALAATRRAPEHRRLRFHRSRNGCITCKRRKVRCNEQTPQCSHCERLGLKCEWKDPAIDATSPTDRTNREVSFDPGFQTASSNARPYSGAIFDFSGSTINPVEDLSFFQDDWLDDIPDFSQAGHSSQSQPPPASTMNLANANAPEQLGVRPRNTETDAQESAVSQVHPILEPVESGPRQASLRSLLDDMAHSSSMVRSSIAAFTTIQKGVSPREVDDRRFYNMAASTLADTLRDSRSRPTTGRSDLRQILVTIFFLTYVDVCFPSICL